MGITLKMFAGLLAILLFSQCKKDESSTPVLDVKQKNVSFIQQGETKVVEINANNEWNINIPAIDQEWLSYTKSGNELKLTAKANSGESLRESTITVTSANLSEEIKVNQFGINIEIIPAVNTLPMEFGKRIYELVVSSNTEYEIFIDESVDWLKVVEKPAGKADLTDRTHYFESTDNYTGKLRSTIITFKQINGSVTADVRIQQSAFSNEDEPLPVDDIKIPVKSAWASSEHISAQGSTPIANAIDGNMGTIWHSAWGTSNWPIDAIFYFENAGDMDYLMYYPRTDSHTNGNFKEFKLYVSYTENPDRSNPAHWTYYNQYDFAGANTASQVDFSPALNNPTAIKFEVLSGMGDNSNGFAGAAEIEFYKKREFEVDLTQFFADDLCTTLKSGVTANDILTSELPGFFKNLAMQLLAGDYSPYRIQEYEAYRPVSDLANEFKTSTYNQYENPTGIWLGKDKDVYVFVPDTNGEKISLISRNWTTSKTGTYPLKKGINLIKPTSTGQAYISYYTPNYKTAQPIKIHISGGEINGYFDRAKNQASEWSSILNNAAGDHIDMVGTYNTCVFNVAALKANCPNDGMKLIELYDEIIEMEYELMGLFLYNKVPKNRMLGRNMPDGFMHADGLGAAFNNETMNSIGNPANIVKGGNSWGIAHEYGHVNQIRPGLKWVGTAEVTNNIYSSYVQYVLTKKYSTLDLRLEFENCKPIEGAENVVGGRFNSHLHYGVLKGDNWLFQWGQDADAKEGKVDHFVKLVPLWQLNLYFRLVEGAPWRKPNWYAQICEETRNTNDASFTNGQHQINFIKRVCKYTETDLTEFFEKAGMLKPINRTIDDYGEGNITITEAMCNEVKTYVQNNGWQKPAGVINYISGNTVDIYKNQSAVSGTLNQGVSGTGVTRTVNHSSWKNAVVYETYNNNELVRITMAGTGTTNNSSTIVPYPSGATKIVAVSWNGTRTTIYQP